MSKPQGAALSSIKCPACHSKLLEVYPAVKYTTPKSTPGSAKFMKDMAKKTKTMSRARRETMISGPKYNIVCTGSKHAHNTLGTVGYYGSCGNSYLFSDSIHGLAFNYLSQLIHIRLPSIINGLTPDDLKAELSKISEDDLIAFFKTSELQATFEALINEDDFKLYVGIHKASNVRICTEIGLGHKFGIPEWDAYIESGEADRYANNVIGAEKGSTILQSGIYPNAFRIGYGTSNILFDDKVPASAIHNDGWSESIRILARRNKVEALGVFSKSSECSVFPWLSSFLPSEYLVVEKKNVVLTPIVKPTDKDITI